MRIAILGMVCASALAACSSSEALPSDCDNRECPEGFVCQDDACVEQGCLDVTCEEGKICVDGDCLVVDCERRNCPGVGEVCVDEECVPTSCVDVEGGKMGEDGSGNTT